MPASPSASDVADKADAYLERLVSIDRFSGSVLLARGDDVLLREGYAFANREHDVPNTSSTKFRLASVTKQFTAMAVMLLVEDGKVSVTQSVCDVLPGAPETWAPVTVRHLLNHTSGIPNFTDGIDWTRTARARHTLDQVIDLFRDLPLAFPPGTRQSYSNSGYLLLGKLVEVLSGASYDEFLSRTIFGPLGMSDSGLDAMHTVVGNMAEGYDLEDNDYVHAGYLDMGLAHAAGGLYATTGDLLRWSRALDRSELLPQSRLAEMSTIAPLLANYGYGFTIALDFNRRHVGHAGGIHGFSTHLSRYPDEEVCIVVLANLGSAKASDVAKTLAAIAFGEDYTMPDARDPVAVADSALEGYCGRYELHPGIGLEVTLVEERLLVQTSDGARSTFLAGSETTFFRRSDDTTLTFVTNDDGDVTHLVHGREGVEARAVRVD